MAGGGRGWQRVAVGGSGWQWPGKWVGGADFPVQRPFSTFNKLPSAIANK